MALKASPSDQALLLDLQALDTRLNQINHRAKSLAQHAVVKTLLAEREGHASRLAEQSGILEDAEIELGRIESDVALVEARITRDVDRLQVTSSVKDVQALEQELTALRQRQSNLEEIELTVMERVEEQASTVRHITDEVDEVQQRIAAVESERDTELGTIEIERANVAANRAEVQAKIPEDLLALYEKTRARYGIGASHLRGGVSGANGVRLNENDMVAIRSAAPDEVLMCPDSFAILVRTSESGLG
jgi:predicted  nucleic acid-binding Zn-ribbon protein